MKSFTKNIFRSHEVRQPRPKVNSSAPISTKQSSYKLSADPKLEILLVVIFVLISVLILSAFFRNSQSITAGRPIKDSPKLDASQQAATTPSNSSNTGLIAKDSAANTSTTQLQVTSSASSQSQTSKVTLNGQTINVPNNGSYSKTIVSNDGNTNININSSNNSESSTNNSSTTVNVKNFTD